MSRKIIFDTLRYVKMLERGGVKHPETHCFALSEAITHNVYTKIEVDKMIETTFQRFEARTREIAKGTEVLKQSLENNLSVYRAHHDKEFLQLENRVEKAINRSMYSIVSILGGLIVTVGVIATFAHSFFH